MNMDGARVERLACIAHGPIVNAHRTRRGSCGVRGACASGFMRVRVLFVVLCVFWIDKHGWNSCTP